MPTIDFSDVEVVGVHPGDVRRYGATGTGTETTAFTAAVAAAIAAGVKEVYIPFPTFTVANNTDAGGLRVRGEGTVLTGMIRNTAGFRNCVISSVLSDDQQVSPPVRVVPIPRLLARLDANTYYVFHEGLDGRYRLHILKNKVTTTTASLATSFTEDTSLRLTQTLHAVEVLVAYKTAKTESGTWANVALGTGAGVPAYTSGSALNYRSSSTIGAYGDYELVVGKDGKFNIGFLMSSSSSSTVKVSIDGVLVDTLSLVSASTQQFVKEYQTTPGTHTVRIENGTAGSTSLHIIGLNLFSLRDYIPGRQVSHYGYYRNNTYADYVTDNGAEDYAIFEDDAQLWGGSYHGGETAITTQILMDGAVVAPAVGGIALGRQLEIRNKCTIDWTARGGGSLTARSRLRAAGQGQMAFECQMTGSAVVKTIFTGMTDTAPSFTDILYPIRADLSIAAEQSRTYVGRTNRVVQGHPTTGQRLVTDLTMFANDENNYGGPHVWKIAAQYNKLYHSPLANGRRTITNIGFTVVWTFE